MANIARLPQPLNESWDWQRLAACRDLPDTLFFHPDGEREGRRRRRAERAKAVCEPCPVRAPCLRHSLSAQEPYGTWGGVDEQHRAAMLRRRRHRTTDTDTDLATDTDPARDRSMKRR